jgi:2-polyprenyl-3-methyl-5-hydroxy-6-metoxy-1,4-benzoquinol methylase
MKRHSCILCSAESSHGTLERAGVRSNVRAFRDNEYAVWRCGNCRSIHATDDVDLALHYAAYPFHDLGRDIRLSIVYSKLLSRLRRSGLRRSSTLLDYGCGSGAFVEFLRDRGYGGACGYDEFNPEMARPARLSSRYDFVLAQDVVEHVDAPLVLLTRLGDLAAPGGVVAIGTPDAERIELARANDFIHTLHAPYHRHIFSRRALEQATAALGWVLERRYATMYTNTLVPFMNEAFYRFYAGLFDDTLDALFGPVNGAVLLRNLPRALWTGVFGSFASRKTDPMTIFRRP